MKKAKDYAVIVSIFSAAIALTCVGIVAFHNFDQNGVVELGTFIGISVALIGICVTLIVGLQILNYIEFKDVKNKISLIDDLNTKFSEKKNAIDILNADYNRNFGNAFSALAETSRDVKLKVMFEIMSIVFHSRDIRLEDSSSEFTRYKDLIPHVDMYLTLDDFQEPIDWKIFKQIDFPPQMKHYAEIMSLHSQIIIKIDNALRLKNTNNK